MEAISRIGQTLQRSLGVKMMTAFIFIIIVVLSVFTLFAVLREGAKTRTALREQGEMLVELLSRSSMLGVFSENPEMLKEAVRDILSLRDVIAVSIYNNRFRELYAERKGEANANQLWNRPLQEDLLAAGTISFRETAETLELMKPVVLDSGGNLDETIYFGAKEKGGRRKVIGYVGIVLTKESYRHEILSIIKQNILITVFFILLSTGLISFAIRRVIAPLVNLTEKVKDLGRGLPVEPVAVETQDEVGNLAASFNETVRARSEAERSLRESEERYRRLVDLSPDAIYVQHDGRIVFVNPSGILLFGAADPGEVIGKPATDLIDESCRSEVEFCLQQIQNNIGCVSPLRVRYRQMKNSTIEAEIAMAPFPLQGSTASLIIARDLTERRGMEEQIKLYQKQLFSVASEMSALESRVEERERHLIASDLHDYVGQNLAVMAFMIGRLQKMLITSEAQRLLLTMGETLEHTIQYTRSLTIELNPPILTELGFKPALEALAESFQKTHGIRVRIEDDDRSKPVQGEVRYLLFRCVRELLLNAVKHSRSNSVHIAVSTEGHRIQVIVQDNGIGIAVSSMARDSRGFGLFSVQERLKRLGGYCAIQNVSGGGTRVVLVAPLDLKENVKEETGGYQDTSCGRS